MSFDQSVLVQRVRWHLGDKPWESMGSATSGSSDITVSNGPDWAQGDVGEFVEDGDTFWVRSPVGDDLTVVRDYYGSTGAPHATGRILKNPKYAYNEITNAISTTIQAFLPWPRVYKVASDTITPSSSNTAWYDLASDAWGIVSVFQIDDNVPAQRRHYGQHHKYNRVEFERNLPTDLVSSGVGLRFPDGFLDVDNTVYVKYAAKVTDNVTTGAYTDFTDSSAVVETIIMGTVALLQGSLELRKPRRAAQETDNLRSASYFNRIYHSALAQAEKELRVTSPLMHTTRTT